VPFALYGGTAAKSLLEFLPADLNLRRIVFMKLAKWLALLILVGSHSQATTLIATGDVFLENGSANQGGDSTLKVNPSFGVLTSLIQFDLTAFAGQTVTGPGTLTLTVHGGPGNIEGGTIALHAMLIPWSEFIVTFANLGGTPGAQAGVDFDSLILATFGGSVGSGNPQVNFTVPASVIQGWINNSSSNFGFILEPNTATQINFDFLSREGGAAPTLTFESVAAPPSGVPEPSTAWLAICGFGTFAAVLVKRSSRAK